MSRRERRWLIAAVVFSLAVRLCLAGVSWLLRHDLAAFHTPDSLRYLLLGAALAAGDGYALYGVPELFRVPGLPALIAIVTPIADPTVGTIAVQALAGAATTWLCFLAGLRIAGVRAGLWAAWLYALEPGQWVWSSMVMTETLFTFCIAAMLVAAIAYLQTGRRSALLVAVTAACAGAYVRVIGYLMAPITIAACGLLAGRPQRGSSRRVWRDAGIAAMLAVVLLGAWHARNGFRTGYWGFSTQFERAVYFVGGGSLQAQHGGTYGEAVGDLSRRVEAGGTPAQIASEMRRSGFAKVAQQPIAFVTTYTAGIATTLLHPGVGGVIRLLRKPAAEGGPSVTQMLTLGRWHDARRLAAQKGSAYWILFVPLQVLTILYFVLFAAGAWAGRSSPLVRFPVLVAVTLLLCSGGPDGDSRRRAPLLPLMCVVAAVALDARERLRIVRRSAGKRHRHEDGALPRQRERPTEWRSERS